MNIFTEKDFSFKKISISDMHICKLSLFWLIFAWYMFSHSVLVLWDITGFYTFTEILLLLFLQFFFLSICLLFLSRLLLDSFNLFPSLLL